MGCCHAKHAQVLDCSTIGTQYQVQSAARLTPDETKALQIAYTRKLGQNKDCISRALLSSSSKGLLHVYYMKLLKRVHKRRNNRQALQVLVSTTRRGLATVYYRKLSLYTQLRLERNKAKAKQQLVALELLLSSVKRGTALVYWRKFNIWLERRKRLKQMAGLLTISKSVGSNSGAVFDQLLVAKRYLLWSAWCERRKRAKRLAVELLKTTQRGQTAAAYYKWRSFLQLCKLHKGGRRRPHSNKDRGTSVSTLLEQALGEFAPPSTTTVTPGQSENDWTGPGTRGGTPRVVNMIEEPSYSDDEDADDYTRMQRKAVEGLLMRTERGTITVFYHKWRRHQAKKATNKMIADSLQRTTERAVARIYYTKLFNFVRTRRIQKKALWGVQMSTERGFLNIYYHKWLRLHSVKQIESHQAAISQVQGRQRQQLLVAVDSLCGKNQLKTFYTYYQRWVALLTKRKRHRRIAENLLSNTNRGKLIVYYTKLCRYSGATEGMKNMIDTQMVTRRERRRQQANTIAESLLTKTHFGTLCLYYHKWMKLHTRHSRNKKVAEALELTTDKLLARKYMEKLDKLRVRRRRAQHMAEVLLQKTQHGNLLVSYRKWLRCMKRRQRSQEVARTLLVTTTRGQLLCYYKKLQAYAALSLLQKRHAIRTKEHKQCIAETLLRCTTRGVILSYYRKLALHCQQKRVAVAHEALYNWDELSRKIEEERKQEKIEWNQKIVKLQEGFDEEISKYKSQLVVVNEMLLEQKNSFAALEESNVIIQENLLNTENELSATQQKLKAATHTAREATANLQILQKDLTQQTRENNRTKVLLTHQTDEYTKLSTEYKSKIELWQQSTVTDDHEAKQLRGQMSERAAKLSEMEQDVVATQNMLKHAQIEKAGLEEQLRLMRPPVTETAVQSIDGDGSVLPLPTERAKLQFHLVTETKRELRLEDTNSINFSNVGKRLNIKIYLPIGVPAPGSVLFYVNGKPRGAPIDEPPYYLMGEGGIWKPETGQAYVKVELYTAKQAKGVMYEYGHIIVSFYEAAGSRSLLAQQIATRN